MRVAISEARLSSAGDWPFGAVIAQDGAILARAHNEVAATSDCSRHAELLAVARATAASGNRHLPRATLFSTHEPCTMCIGAILNAKLVRVVIGSRRADRPDLFDRRAHDIQTLASDGRTAPIQVRWDVLRDDCLALFDAIAPVLIEDRRAHLVDGPGEHVLGPQEAYDGTRATYRANAHAPNLAGGGEGRLGADVGVPLADPPAASGLRGLPSRRELGA